MKIKNIYFVPVWRHDEKNPNLWCFLRGYEYSRIWEFFGYEKQDARERDSVEPYMWLFKVKYTHITAFEYFDSRIYLMFCKEFGHWMNMKNEEIGQPFAFENLKQISLHWKTRRILRKAQKIAKSFFKSK